MQNKRTLASRFFELLRASLRLNTQRRSASSMCAFKKEERSVPISVTSMELQGTKLCQLLTSRSVCM